MSYDRVQEIRKKFGNQICEQFLKSEVAWEYSLPKSISKAYKMSSSNTTSGSANFNGTEEATANFNTSNGDSRKKLKGIVK